MRNKTMMNKEMKTIYLAGGCFWGTEHYINIFDGIAETATGYANGSIPSPTYEQVYTDSTGHAECVKVTYDPAVISLRTLCLLFFRSIDPMLENRQGDDVGTRYRTGIYWTSDEDREIVEEVFEKMQKRFDKPMKVEKCPLKCFYPAEDYHQDYLAKNPGGYCHLSMETFRFAKRYSKLKNKLR